MDARTINYLINPEIEWVVKHGSDFTKNTATGKWQDWEFSVERNGRGGWNIKVNGIQAWVHMRGFNDAMGSVRDRLRDWAYMNQFRS